MAAEHRLRHLDRNLVGPRARYLDLRDLRDRRQLVAHALGHRLQREFVRVTRKGEIDDLTACQQLLNDRFLGLLGEGVDRVDTALDVVQDAADIGAELELDHHAPHPFRRGRGELLDAVESLDGLLDPDAHRSLYLVGRHAQVRDLDVDSVERDFRKDLGVDVDDRDDPAAISHGQRNNSASCSDGFIQPRVCRGRSLSTCATRFRCRWLWTDKSLPRGKY